METQDKSIVCRECTQIFTWTTGQQAWYAERGLREPKRCPDCRAARKAQALPPWQAQ